MSTVLEPQIPTADEEIQARESARILSSLVQRSLKFKIEDEGKTIVLPQSAVRLLFSLLQQMSHGNAVSLIPIHAEMTTQQAADFLNVSRPFLIKEIEAKKIPYKKVGTHRRIRFKDLMEYKNAIDSRRANTLDELAAQAQELDMGY